MDFIKKILPNILALATNHTRYEVVPGIDFNWSARSFTHNIFRFLELIFWRRAGIRREAYSASFIERGKRITVHRFYTSESLIAHTEGMIRELIFNKLSFRFVPIPAMMTSEGIQMPLAPIFSFAIARDATSEGHNSLADNNYNHTCTGTNLILCTHTFNNVTTDTMTAKYATVAMTSVVTQALNGADGKGYIFYLINPSTGTNTVNSNSVNNDQNLSQSVSYTGAKQSGQPDSSAVATQNSGTGLTCTATVVAASCWLVSGGDTNGTFGAPGTGTSAIQTTLGYSQLYDSNGTVGTGSQSLITNTTGSAASTQVMMTVAPAAAAAAVTHFRTLLGVGT